MQHRLRRLLLGRSSFRSQTHMTGSHLPGDGKQAARGAFDDEQLPKRGSNEAAYA